MNRGAQMLSDRLAERGEQTRLAEKLGLDQGYLSKIARAVRVPGLEARRKLEEHCGIAMQLWDQEIPDGRLPVSETAPDPEAA